MMLFMEDELAALARTTVARPLRCAVYTRVLVEDGQKAFPKKRPRSASWQASGTEYPTTLSRSS